MSVESWKELFDIGTIVLLLLTGVFAAGIFLTGNKINERQAEQLRNFDKDLTEAKTKLGEQQTRAAKAELDVAEAKSTAHTANTRTLSLQKAASDAKADQQRVELELAKQQERAATAEKNLETERIARLELQETMSLRTLVVNGESIERLGQFKGTPFVLVVSTDAEAQYLANQLAFSLDRAEWKNMGILPSLDLAQGVEVRLAQRDRPIEADDPQRRIGAVLVEYLEANRIEAALRPATINVVGLSNGIVISIGMKPQSMLMQKGLTEAMSEQGKIITRQIEDSRKARMEELRKKWKFPPYDKPRK